MGSASNDLWTRINPATGVQEVLVSAPDLDPVGVGRDLRELDRLRGVFRAHLNHIADEAEVDEEADDFDKGYAFAMQRVHEHLSVALNPPTDERPTDDQLRVDDEMVIAAIRDIP